MVNKSGQWPVCSVFLLFRTDFSPKHTHTHMYTRHRNSPKCTRLELFCSEQLFFCILHSFCQVSENWDHHSPGGILLFSHIRVLNKKRRKEENAFQPKILKRATTVWRTNHSRKSCSSISICKKDPGRNFDLCAVNSKWKVCVSIAKVCVCVCVWSKREKSAQMLVQKRGAKIKAKKKAKSGGGGHLTAVKMTHQFSYSSA